MGHFARFTTNGSLDGGIQPCCEYLFDYRNGSMLRQWMLTQHYFGTNALGDPDVSGLFIDDAWTVKGLTEEGSTNLTAGIATGMRAFEDLCVLPT